MPPARRLSSSEVEVTFKGEPVHLVPGSTVWAQRNKEPFSESVGATGHVTRVKNNDRTGTVTLTPQRGTPEFQALVSATIDGAWGDLLVTDVGGNVVVRGSNAWRNPDRSNGTWVFDVAELELPGA